MEGQEDGAGAVGDRCSPEGGGLTALEAPAHFLLSLSLSLSMSPSLSEHTSLAGEEGEGVEGQEDGAGAEGGGGGMLALDSPEWTTIHQRVTSFPVTAGRASLSVLPVTKISSSFFLCC